jgi:hypothetical protein
MCTRSTVQNLSHNNLVTAAVIYWSRDERLVGQGYRWTPMLVTLVQLLRLFRGHMTSNCSNGVTRAKTQNKVSHDDLAVAAVGQW